MITLYRRYHELNNSINRIQEIKGEFKVPPVVVLVWADPEPDKFYLMEKYIMEGKIHHILERKKSEYDGWGKPTTPAELLNFNVGINFIKSNFINYYVILQGADILVQPGIYYWISQEIKNYPAILFFWNSGLEVRDAWHTNFFVVKDLAYWPRFVKKYEFNTLETMWGKSLLDSNLTSFLHSHNSRHLKFQEVHSSLKETYFPSDTEYGVFCFKDGVFAKSWFKQFKLYIIKGLKWLKLK